jgi:hypothetical protein
MGAKIALCHWNEGGSWNSLELPLQALEAQGHPNHALDIWPSSAGTPGNNWPQGEAIFLNGCAMVIHPEPTATASPSSSPSLPESGTETLGLSVLALVLIVVGVFLMARSEARTREKLLEEFWTLKDSQQFRGSDNDKESEEP